MDREPDVALSITAFGSPAKGTILPDISSTSTASRIMLSTFATAKSFVSITVSKNSMTLKEIHSEICDFNGSLSQEGFPDSCCRATNEKSEGRIGNNVDMFYNE